MPRGGFCSTASRSPPLTWRSSKGGPGSCALACARLPGSATAATTRSSTGTRRARADAFGLLLVVAIRRERRVHPRVLVAREMIHAPVVGIVHEVVDGIEARLRRAAVATDRAAEGRRPLRRRIGDEVSFLRAAALERVIQAHPVSDLVRRRIAEVVWRRGPTRQRGIEHHDAVL